MRLNAQLGNKQIQRGNKWVPFTDRIPMSEQGEWTPDRNDETLQQSQASSTRSNLFVKPDIDEQENTA